MITVKYNEQLHTFIDREEMDKFFELQDWDVYMILQWLGRRKFRNLSFKFESDQVKFEIVENQVYQPLNFYCPN